MLIKQLPLTTQLEARLAACHDGGFSLSVQQVVREFTEAPWDEILPEACGVYHYTISSGRVGPVQCEPGDVLVTRDGEELNQRERTAVRAVVLLALREQQIVKAKEPGAKLTSAKVEEMLGDQAWRDRASSALRKQEV